VNGAIDGLAPEVPAVECNFGISLGIGHFDRLDLDPVGGQAALFPRVAAQGTKETTFADFALTDQDELGLVQHHLCFRFGAQVGSNRSETFLVGGCQFRVQWVFLKMKAA
jgi:hypothetical protein